jgi:transcriptional regulator with XRE-family HTH domain
MASMLFSVRVIRVNFKKKNELYASYTRRIRDLREDHDKTQQEIAEYLGTSQTMYARYERGANEMPIRHLISLSQYYNVSSDYILGLSRIKRRADELR